MLPADCDKGRALSVVSTLPSSESFLPGLALRVTQQLSLPPIAAQSWAPGRRCLGSFWKAGVEWLVFSHSAAGASSMRDHCTQLGGQAQCPRLSCGVPGCWALPCGPVPLLVGTWGGAQPWGSGGRRVLSRLPCPGALHGGCWLHRTCPQTRSSTSSWPHATTRNWRLFEKIFPRLCTVTGVPTAC